MEQYQIEIYEPETMVLKRLVNCRSIHHVKRAMDEYVTRRMVERGWNHVYIKPVSHEEAYQWTKPHLGIKVDIIV